MRGRIRPPRELESVLDRLSENEVFETKQKGMMFAAAVGLAEDSQQEIESYGEGIRLQYFKSVGDLEFIDALAVAHCDTLDVLADDRVDERLEIFESYAAAGLAEMREKLEQNKTRPDIYVVIDLIENLPRPEQNDRVEQLDGLL